MALDTDYKAAKALHISQTTVSGWRKGRSHAATGLAAKMAKDMGENIALWCAAIEVERAHNADDRRAWEQILRQLTAAVAVVVLALGVIPFQAQAIDFNGVSTHYAKLSAGAAAGSSTDGRAWCGVCCPCWTRSERRQEVPMIERPPCWPEGQRCPNNCAAQLQRRVVYNQTPLFGPWAGWRLAGTRLIAPSGEWVAPHLLDRWLYRHNRMFRDA
ncbi:DUF3693 domain-containing protein [Lysobacter enzymogenes]|uniref:DUF3693 domain-containing protein n=1 Tax=Lysobacter enzymogenes TaxID=69 RepID=UPI0019CFE734|nr:DUF3693 domain-containing protein [Lysobacter enzymogenes]